jgi:uncharacterized protein YrrD
LNNHATCIILAVHSRHRAPRQDPPSQQEDSVSTIKASELKGRAVVSLTQAEKIGTVASVILDPAASRVAGLTVRTGILGGPKLLRASDIRSLGADAVTIHDSSLLHDGSGEAPELKDLPTLDDMVEMKIISESGQLLGTLGNIEIDPDQYQITRYELSGTLWDQLTHSNRTFDASPGLRFGKELLIVPDAVVAALQRPSTPPDAEADLLPPLEPPPGPAAPPLLATSATYTPAPAPKEASCEVPVDAAAPPAGPAAAPPGTHARVILSDTEKDGKAPDAAPS